MFKPVPLAGFLMLTLLSLATQARVSAEEAAALGQSLTPVGAERAGNPEGTIPAWMPGKQRGKLSGEFLSDPGIDAEKPLFTITRANVAQYAERLSEGHKKLLGLHDSYKLDVYPGHRLAAMPEAIYNSTRANATTCELKTADEIDNCTLGFPFPIPKSGAEPIWNHKLRWRGDAVLRYNNQMIVQPNGKYQLTKIVEDVQFIYGSVKKPGSVRNNQGDYLKYLVRTIAPPRVAGTTILVHEKAGAAGDSRAAWIYSPTLKRIRRLPSSFQL